MTMRKGVNRALLVVTAAVLAVGFGASAALAASLTVKVSGGGSVTAVSSKVVLADNSASVTCTSSRMSGSIPNRTTKGSSPVRIGSFRTLGFSGCTGPLGPVTMNGRLPFGLSVDSKTVNGKTDVILGFGASLSMNGCSFAMSGSVPGYFTNSTHILTLTPKLPIKPLETSQLTIGNVSGCTGLISNGDHPTFTAKYKFLHLVIKST